MSNTLHLPENQALAEKVLDNSIKERSLLLQYGWLGKVFGSGPDASVRVAALVLIILSLAGVIYTFCAPDNSQFGANEFWKVLAPIITSFAGFIFGKAGK